MLIKTILIIVGVVTAVLVSGGFIGDYVLRDNLGIGLFDLLTALSQSGNTLEGSASFNTVTPDSIGSEVYSNLSNEKLIIEETFAGIKRDIESVVNSNPELTQGIKDNLGANYSVYMFSVYTMNGLTFKVFEWTVGTTEGLITRFEPGKTLDNYNVILQIDHSIASDLLSGNADTETMAGWITEQKIKINPITEVVKITTLLPAITSAMN